MSSNFTFITDHGSVSVLDAEGGCKVYVTHKDEHGVETKVNIQLDMKDIADFIRALEFFNPKERR